MKGAGTTPSILPTRSAPVHDRRARERDARDRRRRAAWTDRTLAILAAGLRPGRSPAPVHVRGESPGLSLRRGRPVAPGVQGAAHENASPRGRARRQQELPRPHGLLPRPRRGPLSHRGSQAPQGRVPGRGAEARDHVPPAGRGAGPQLRAPRCPVRALCVPPAAGDLGRRCDVPLLRRPEWRVPLARLARVELRAPAEDGRHGGAGRAGALRDGLSLPVRDLRRGQGPGAGPASARQVVSGRARHVRPLGLSQCAQVHPLGPQVRGQCGDPSGLQAVRGREDRRARAGGARGGPEPPLPVGSGQEGVDLLSLCAAQKEFEAEGVYVNTATIGLPPRRALDALHDAIETWRTGRAEAAGYDGLITSARQRFASLVSTTPDRVASGNQVSTSTALVASALPDGARVLAAEEDFTSVLFPFLAHADRGVRVRTVPLAGLIDAIRPGVDLVAVSAAQSADGRLVPGGLDALAAAASHCGCLTYVDATQAVGWLPFEADQFDFVACAAYKWLLSPRGTAFGVVRPERLGGLRPLYAGWYAGDDPWTSIYSPPLRLAPDARRLDISPAWLAWVGTVPALELLAEVGIDAIHRHDLALANALRARLGRPSGDSAIVALATEGGLDRLRAEGIRASARAGSVRVSFHLHNTDSDVEAVARALDR